MTDEQFTEALQAKRAELGLDPATGQPVATPLAASIAFARAEARLRREGGTPSYATHLERLADAAELLAEVGACGVEYRRGVYVLLQIPDAVVLAISELVEGGGS